MVNKIKSLMKKIFLPGLLLLFFYSCSHNSGSTDKRTELEKLKKEQSQLKEKISKLEEELSKENNTADDKSKIVAVTEIKPELFHHYIEVQAKVEGEEDVLLSAETMGNVTSVSVKAGDNVNKDQVLATIDDRMVRQGIAEVQSQLDLATQIYSKQKNLWDQKIGSEVQYLQSKTAKESLEKRMASMQEQLNQTRIKSPIEGTVDDVKIKVGQTVVPGAPAIRVVNLTELKVKGAVA